MRVLGLDIGEKRIGVAVSDPAGRVATPVSVIAAEDAVRDGRVLTRLVEDYEVELVVVGLPLSMDGTEGPQARRVRAQAQKMAQFLPVTMQFVDERLSSAEAKRRMQEAGADERRQRGSVDMVAASILLQSYLDAHVASDDQRSENQ